LDQVRIIFVALVANRFLSQHPPPLSARPKQDEAAPCRHRGHDCGDLTSLAIKSGSSGHVSPAHALNASENSKGLIRFIRIVSQVSNDYRRIKVITRDVLRTGGQPSRSCGLSRRVLSPARPFRQPPGGMGSRLNFSIDGAGFSMKEERLL